MIESPRFASSLPANLTSLASIRRAWAKILHRLMSMKHSQIIEILMGSEDVTGCYIDPQEAKMLPRYYIDPQEAKM
jgi:hypothetical protein